MGRRPKDVYGYSDALWQIVEAVAVGGKTLQVTVESVQAARKMRGKFYAFRQGLAEAIKDATSPTSPHHENLGRLQDTLQWSRVTVCWFDEPQEGGLVTVFYMNKNDTPDATLYKAALASGGATPPDLAAIEESAQRVADALEDQPKKNTYY